MHLTKHDVFRGDVPRGDILEMPRHSHLRHDLHWGMSHAHDSLDTCWVGAQWHEHLVQNSNYK